MHLLWIGIGGGLGALGRYGLVSFLAHRSVAFPWGTLAVNALGCLLIGAAFERLSTDGRAFVVVGLLGGFTTFSAFGHETVELVRRGQATLALLNAGGNVVLGIGAVLLGRAVVALF